MKILEDIFKGIKNKEWDLARISGAWAIISYSGAFIYALIKDHVPTWSDLGIGYAAVLGASAAFIGIKDITKAKADAITQGTDNG